MRLFTTFLVALCYLSRAVGADVETIKPVPFDTGRQQATFKPEELIHLGAGYVTHASLSKNLLAVSVLRTPAPRSDQPSVELPLHGPLPRTPWYGVNTIELYRLQPDGSADLLTSLPQQYPVQMLALSGTKLYVTDAVGVAVYYFDAKKHQLSFGWKCGLPNVKDIGFVAPFTLFRTPETVQLVEDSGISCELRTDAPGFVKEWAYAGLAERLFVVDRGGDCSLYNIPPTGTFMPDRDLPLLGDVLSLTNYGANLLVLDRDFGLRLMISAELTKKPPRNRTLDVAQSFDEPRFQDPVFKAKYVLSELPLPKGQVQCRAFGPWVYLLDEQGKLSVVPIDPQTHQLGKLNAVEGVGPIAEIAGDADEQVVMGRDGSVTRLREGKVLAQLPTGIQPGPWFELDGQLFVTRGGAVHAIEKGTWGAEVFRDQSTILDAHTRGSQVWLLSEQQLSVAELKDGKFAVVGSVKVPAESVFLRLGPDYAAVVHGDRGLAMIDIHDPAKLRIVSDRELEMPTHSEVVSKSGEDKTFEIKIRDVLVEKERVFVLGTEIFLYDLKQLAGSEPQVKWKSTWHRPYVSADDLIYTQSIRPLGDDRYFVTAYRHESFPYSRAYVITMKGDAFVDWRYCRLGASSALDMEFGPDGLAFVAGGFDGLRLLRLGETDTYLGSEYEPNGECQALIIRGDQVFTRSGNTLRRYSYKLELVKEETAFTFAPQGDALPKIAIDGLDVTSAEYQEKMGYRNPLRLVKTDLSDAAGFPATKVLQGTVAVDPKLGRIKFADGRNAEPKFLSRAEYINVYPAGWRKAGKYFIAALSEQSQGFAVMDLSDPTCMKVISLAGQPNGFTYPHTVIAERDGYAYITGNVLNCLLPVNMKDPLKPTYERMINLKNGGVAKFSCVTHYSGFFRGDRLYIPGGAGITEVDVSDPTNIQRIAVHAKGAGIHQVLDKEQRAVRWNTGKLEYLDIADPANPTILGSYKLENASPVSTVTAEGSTYVLAATGPTTKSLFRIDISDMSQPKLAAQIPLAGDVKALWPEKGYVYLTGNRSFYVVDWQEPASPRILAHLDEPNFLGTWKYSFLDPEGEPRTTEVTGGGHGIDLQIEIKDGNTVWISSMSAVYAVDVADPAKPKVVGSGPGFGELWWVCSDDSDLVSIGSYRRAFVDVSDPLHPKVMKEYYHGHPQEIGTPAEGNSDYQVGTSNIWKWSQDLAARKFEPDPNALLPLWLGPDPQEIVDGHPACLITGGTGRATKVRSEPIAVKPGDTLYFQGQFKTVGGTDFAHVPQANNWPHGTITISVVMGPKGKPLANVANNRVDGEWYAFARGLRVPAGVEEVQFEIAVRGDTWVTDLQLSRGEEKLLANPNFDQPLTDKGEHPHWSVFMAGGQKHNSSAGDKEVLCVLQARDVLIYDLTKNSKFPVSRISGAMHPLHDGPVKVLIGKSGDRKVAYLYTQMGLVTLDITDPYHPRRLGSLSMPFLRGATIDMALAPNCLVMVPSYVSNHLTEGFYLVDISNPAQPRLRGSAFGRNHSGAVCHNGYLYLGDYSQGMQVWDVRDLDRPKMITNMGFVRCAQTWAIEFHGNHVLRPEVGGLELWEVPVLPQSPAGKLTIEN